MLSACTSGRERCFLPEDIKQRLKELKSNIPIISDAIDTKIDSEHAPLLSEAIINYESRTGHKVWERYYITCDTPDFSFFFGGG